MNCLIYSRVSTEEQAENGRSIDDQVKICDKFAKDNGYKIVGVYKDAGKSATNMKRPALQDMLLRSAEDGSVETVLVQDTDRLARNPSDHLQIKALLKKNGVQVISISQPMVTGDSPESQFIDLVIAGMNQFQSQITGRKTSKVMEQKVLEGWWPGRPMLGYNNETIDGKNIITPDDERAPYIKRAFELFSGGVRSVEQVNNQLYEQGLRSRDGGKVSKSNMTVMLGNIFYTGQMLYKDKIYQGKHEPLIDRDLFEACQQVLCEHNQGAVRSRKYQFLLRGFLFCKKCGSRLYAEKHFKKNGAVYDFYFCQNCKGNSYNNVAEVEKGVELLFKQIRLPESMINKLLMKAKAILADTHGRIDKDKQVLESKKAILEKKRNKLENKLLDEVIDNETYKRQHKAIEDEIKELNDKIGQLHCDRSENIEIFERLLRVVRNLYETYKEATPEGKRNLLALFWERFELQDGGIEKTVPSKIIQALFSQKSIQTNSKVRVKFLWLPELDSNQ